MDVGDYRIAHRVTVYMMNLSTPEIFSTVFDDPNDASTAEKYIKKVIHLADLDSIYGTTRTEIIIHKRVNFEHLKDLLELLV